MDSKDAEIFELYIDTFDGYPLYKKMGFEKLDREMVLKI